MANQIRAKLAAAARHYQRVVAFAVGVLLGALMVASVLPLVSVAPDGTSAQRLELAEESDETLTVADPLTLRIPSVGIDTTFASSLGVNDDQTIEVPVVYDAVGWYEHGPKPGELGPAVVLGHVDSYEGPAVFWPLRQVGVGDTIEIGRQDGSVAVFEVTKLQEHPQSGFPTTQVYGDIDHAGLRLITCSGTFDRGRQVYSHNLIVFAELSAVKDGLEDSQ